jgi:hypothetical protein
MIVAALDADWLKHVRRSLLANVRALARRILPLGPLGPFGRTRMR